MQVWGSSTRSARLMTRLMGLFINTSGHLDVTSPDSCDALPNTKLGLPRVACAVSQHVPRRRRDLLSNPRVAC